MKNFLKNDGFVKTTQRAKQNFSGDKNGEEWRRREGDKDQMLASSLK